MNVVWVREAVKIKRIAMMKVAGRENPADVLTKLHSATQACNVSKAVSHSRQEPARTDARRSWTDFLARNRTIRRLSCQRSVCGFVAGTT